MFTSIIFAALGGIALSLYAYWLEHTLETNPTYKPSCDISDYVSCSKPIKSPYGRFAGIPYSLLGLFFYSSVIFVALFQAIFLLTFMSVSACFVSGFLAYVLLFKVKAWCLVCTGIYIINGILLLLSLNAL